MNLPEGPRGRTTNNLVGKKTQRRTKMRGALNHGGKNPKGKKTVWKIGGSKRKQKKKKNGGNYRPRGGGFQLGGEGKKGGGWGGVGNIPHIYQSTEKVVQK